MRLFTLPVGSLATNCYILAPDESDACFVIDPGAEPQRIAAELARHSLRPSYLISTHGHADHTGGVAGLAENCGGVFAIGAADAQLAANPPEWLVEHLGDYRLPPSPGHLIGDDETLQAGELKLSALHTPGHTKGSTCFLAGNFVFTGDTLFRGSIGRYDLDGGNGPQELASIMERLLTLPGETLVYPGHGPSTTIAHEAANNPFLHTGPRQQR